MPYPMSSSVIGPSSAQETLGWVYKLWDFLHNRLPTNSPFYVAAGSSIYEITENEEIGTMNPDGPIGFEQVTFDGMYDTYMPKLARHKTKKK